MVYTKVCSNAASDNSYEGFSVSVVKILRAPATLLRWFENFKSSEVLENRTAQGRSGVSEYNM